MDKTAEVTFHNQSDIDIRETEFWLYLDMFPHYHPFIKIAVLNYLEDKYRYMIGRDIISEDAMETLNHIYNHYTQTTMYPKWDAERAERDLYNETMQTP